MDGIHALAKAMGADSGLVLVGGAVRDRLLGREGTDWDLATALMPEEVLRRAMAARLRAIPTGLKHGTVTVLADGLTLEITTYRGDGPYLDGRRPSHVTLGVALEEDLARRDFTINAMALPLEAVSAEDWKERIIDPFNGRKDLAAGIIRAVGDPHDLPSLGGPQEDPEDREGALPFAARQGQGTDRRFRALGGNRPQGRHPATGKPHAGSQGSVHRPRVANGH